MRKSYFVLSISFFFLFCSILVTGCNKKYTEGQVINLRVSDIHPEGYPTVVGLHEFSRLAEERSHGRIKIEVIPGGKEGDETATVEKVQLGKLDFTRASVSPLSSFDSDLEVITIPGEFRNEIHFWKVLDGSIGTELLAGLEKHGFYGLCYYDSGSRSFYTTKKISSYNDLKGMKIRVQQTPVMMEYINALGAVPIPMAFEEIGDALSKGYLDGAENNIPSWEVAEHYNAAPYYFMDEHSRIADILIGSTKTLSSLSEADLKIIKEAAQDSEVVQKLAWKDYEQKSIDAVLKAGAKIIAPDSSDIEKNIEEVQPVLSRRFNASQKILIEQIKQTR